MRTIQFRGKRIDNNKWVFGDLITNNGKPFIVNGVAESNEEYIALENWQPVHPKTVGQFIDLTEKKGKEIYEGDIVECRFMFHGKPSKTMFLSKIIYNQHIACYQISYLNNDNIFVHDDIGFRYELKIIGNIHDNKELLK